VPGVETNTGTNRGFYNDINFIDFRSTANLHFKHAALSTRCLPLNDIINLKLPIHSV
jgi:hypothetical protein